jgi:hypothetical protein
MVGYRVRVMTCFLWMNLPPFTIPDATGFRKKPEQERAPPGDAMGIMFCVRSGRTRHDGCMNPGNVRMRARLEKFFRKGDSGIHSPLKLLGSDGLPLADLVASYARITNRLREALVAFGLATSAHKNPGFTPRRKDSCTETGYDRSWDASHERRIGTTCFACMACR